ncbi:MAG: LapA family protein [Giesbergeria sp.]|uniref:LapA family protein n=1 Tax=Giesbergeria sp. TaxID=2818473 RepID=UPI002602ACBC|nr:LapA family protein [Giesbergeria sp.]MDD2609751.1 LapA family protein [Giesbergeria sp.]
MKYLLWLLKAAIFFTLFAFALNNQQDATVYFFFGTQWRAPMVLLVLSAFALGMVAGVLGMVPRWWMHRCAAQRQHAAAPPPAAADAAAPPSAATAAASTEPPHGI